MPSSLKTIVSCGCFLLVGCGSSATFPLDESRADARREWRAPHAEAPAVFHGCPSPPVTASDAATDSLDADAGPTCDDNKFPGSWLHGDDGGLRDFAWRGCDDVVATVRGSWETRRDDLCRIGVFYCFNLEIDGSGTTIMQCYLSEVGTSGAVVVERTCAASRLPWVTSVDCLVYD